MMNILYIVPYVPSLIRVRPYNLIRGLVDEGHRVSVLTAWTDERELADIDRLRAFCHRVEAVHMPAWRSLLNCLGAFLAGEPLQSWYSWTPRLLSFVDDCRPLDVIHVEHLRGAKYALALKDCGVPVVWDSVDCISHLFRQASNGSRSRFGQLMTRFELGRTGRFEGRLVGQFSRTLVTSQRDKEALAELAPEAGDAIAVLPNGVDLDYFRSDPGVTRAEETLVVTGKMSYHANVTMVLELVERVMPVVWAERPNIELLVVGKDPVRALQVLDGHPRITVTGEVPDMRPYLQRATIAVAPVTYGAGIQNKVLEAMACETPVVTTPRVARTIPAAPGQDLLVGETPQPFADQILRLLNDPQTRLAIGRSGRRFVEQHHCWSTIIRQLEALYDATAIEPQY